MSHQPLQEPQVGAAERDVCGLEAAMASTSIDSPAAAAAGNAAPDSARTSHQGQFIAKGPKKCPVDQSPRGSESRLHQTSGSSGAGQAAGSQVPASLPFSYQQQLCSLVNPVTPIGFVSTPAQPQYQQQQQFPQYVGEFDGADDGFLNEFLLNLPPATEEAARAAVPGSTSEVTITVRPASHASQLQPLPSPMSQPVLPMPLAQPQQATASTSSIRPQQPGPPVSSAVRLALINKLKPPLSPVVDENFNTVLHNAILQKQDKEFIEYWLNDLQSRKKLLPIINSLNCHGHTPLSLCLKLQRVDLIPLLLRYDAAPTQLCGSATERSNHFHYAMCKCLESPQALQVVLTFVHAIRRHCPLDLSGLLAKNRNGVSAMDNLKHRIFQLSSCSLDATGTELLASLQALHNGLEKQLVEA